MKKNHIHILYIAAVALATMLTGCTDVELCERHDQGDGDDRYAKEGYAHNVSVMFKGVDTSDADMCVAIHRANNHSVMPDTVFKGANIIGRKLVMPGEYRFMAYNQGVVRGGEFVMTQAAEEATVFGDNVAYVNNTAYSSNNKHVPFFSDTEVQDYIKAAGMDSVVDFSVKGKSIILQKLALNLTVTAKKGTQPADPVVRVLAADVSGIPLRFRSNRIEYKETAKAKLNFRRAPKSSTLYTDTLQVPTLYCANNDDSIAGVLRVAVETKSGKIVKGSVNIFPTLGTRQYLWQGLYRYDDNEEYIISQKTDGQVVPLNIQTFHLKERKAQSAPFEVVDGKVNEAYGWKNID